MTLFGALDTAASGVHLSRFWLDTTSDNIANVNTVRPADEEPFRARLVVAQSTADGTGVRVGGVRLRDGEPQVVHDPGNPLADADGNVVRPDVDLTEEMSHVLMATRLYQANLSVIKSVQDTWQAALQVGRR